MIVLKIVKDLKNNRKIIKTLYLQPIKLISNQFRICKTFTNSIITSMQTYMINTLLENNKINISAQHKTRI